MTKRMAAEAVNHEAHALGAFSSLFNNCWVNENAFRTLRELR